MDSLYSVTTTAERLPAANREPFLHAPLSGIGLHALPLEQVLLNKISRSSVHAISLVIHRASLYFFVIALCVAYHGKPACKRAGWRHVEGRGPERR